MPESSLIGIELLPGHADARVLAYETGILFAETRKRDRACNRA
jgi:hypothetical protein